MRFARLLAAVAALWVQPANATVLEYGLRFDGTLTYDPAYVVPPMGFHSPYTGTFRFDTATNLLEKFNAYLGVPVPDFTADINEMLGRHPGCDINCFITAINGSGWSFESGPSGPNAMGSVQLSFTGGGFNEFLSQAAYMGNPPYRFRAGGTYIVTGLVPEPATWAMMLVGFGAIGWSIRRKCQAVHYSFG